jgi:hypothetical protein
MSNYILGYKKWNLSEQEKGVKGLVGQTVKFSDNPKSNEIYRLFIQEFLPSIVSKDPKMSVLTWIEKVASISDEDLSKRAISFYKSKGYGMPDERVKTYQTEFSDPNDPKKSKFMPLTSEVRQLKARQSELIKQLEQKGLKRHEIAKNKEVIQLREKINSEKKAFIDGKFGVATAKATLDYYIIPLKKTAEVMSRKIKGDWTWAQQDKGRERQKEQIAKGQVTAARKEQEEKVGRKAAVGTEEIGIKSKTQPTGDSEN